jgi:hypothetical protein
MPVDWYAESFRLSLFVSPNWIRRPLFEEIAGVEPQEWTEKVQLQTRQETGLFFGGQLNIIQQPGVLIIQLADTPTRNINDPTALEYKKFYWIDKLVPALTIFDRISNNIRNLNSPVYRVGYAPTLIFPTNDRTSAMRTLKEMLPLLQFDPDIDTDLVWNINRPRRMEPVGVVNRLSRWNTLQAGFLRITGPELSALPLPPPTEFAARLELDINTPHSIQEMQADSIPGVIQTLRSLALEIADKGDIP